MGTRSYIAKQMGSDQYLTIVKSRYRDEEKP